MPFPQQNLYKNVFSGPITEDSDSLVVLSADFTDIQFSVKPGVILTISNTDPEDGFIVGETVTGDDSGATATIYSVSETEMILENVVGTFNTSDVITGSESTTTADVDAVEEPDFEVFAYKSNQDNMNPPDPSLPASLSNQYLPIMYTGEPGGVNYDTDNPYNPDNGSSIVYNEATFKFYTEGAMWVFIKVVFTSGILLNSNIDLFNNN